MTPVVMEQVKGIPTIIRNLGREISTCFQVIWVMPLIMDIPTMTSGAARTGTTPDRAAEHIPSLTSSFQWSAHSFRRHTNRRCGP